MSNITQVNLTAGVPTGPAGAATVSTIDALMADGGQATVGAIADAAVTAGATGTLSAKLRSLSRDIGSLVTAIGSTAWDLGVGTGGSRTQRMSIDTAQLAALNTTAQAMSAGFQATDPPTDGTFATRTGSLTETAPTTDTASSGLNGRLQRIAQRITSLIGLLPTALGTTGGLKVDDIFSQYKTAAASATTLMGSTGAVGDYLAGVLIVPGTAGCGTVGITDGNGSTISVFAGGGTTALADLKPFLVPLGLYAVNATTAGWRLILGANVTAVGIGKFT